LVVTTIDVSRPTSSGLMIRCCTSPAPLPVTAGSTVQRAVSPRLIELTCSPACRATSHTWSTAQTMLGCCAPNRNLIEPLGPVTGAMPFCHRVLPLLGNGNGRLLLRRQGRVLVREIQIGQVVARSRRGDCGTGAKEQGEERFFHGRILS
jgi:hypothetical protein